MPFYDFNCMLKKVANCKVIRDDKYIISTDSGEAKLTGLISNILVKAINLGLVQKFSSEY